MTTGRPDPEAARFTALWEHAGGVLAYARRHVGPDDAPEVAVAGGLVPQAFTDAFHHWTEPGLPGSPRVDPATAERLAGAPGPDGTVSTIVSAHAGDDPDYRCTTAPFASPASAARPGPAVSTDAFGSVCRPGLHTAAFDSGLLAVSVSDGHHVWAAPAGEAVRAELRPASGEDWPVVLVDGTFSGRFPEPAAGDPRPELVGFAADRTETGRTRT